MKNIEDKIESISIIVIGFNEAANLHQTFSAINSMDYPSDKIELIYVDSGSHDNSIEIASKYTSKIFAEEDFPTASRNRNRGAFEASYDIVHFIDGDVSIQKDYMKIAVEFLRSEKSQAVCGKLIEKKQNWITKILSSAWKDRKEGYVNATHAGGTYLKEAFLQCKGYNPKIKLGEETELGLRFREVGYKIFYTDQIMGYHDYGINSILGYFLKQINDGVSKIDLMFVNGLHSAFYRANYFHSVSNFIQISLFLIFCVIACFFNPFFGILVCILYLFFPFMKFLWKNNLPFAYIAIMHYSKLFVFFGQIKQIKKLLFDKKYYYFLKSY